MPPDPFTFVPPTSPGAPLCRWRAVRVSGGGVRIDRRVLQGREWVEQTAEDIAWEIAHGTHAGGWLVWLQSLGVLAEPADPRPCPGQQQPASIRQDM